jgi:hypothetical protein
MRFNWTEITTLRNPSYANSLIPSPIAMETDGSTFYNTLAIVPYTASLNTTYTIQLEVYLTNKIISSL